MTQTKRRVCIPSQTTPTSTSRLLLKFSPQGELVEFVDIEPTTAPTPEPAPSPEPPKESEVTE